jgi:hypothetical protein
MSLVRKLVRKLVHKTVCALALATLVVAGIAPHAAGQTPAGSTLSPDRQSFLVNKDLAGERWTINLNLYSTDPGDVINATGNIFRPDGGPAAFVSCLLREDSTGALADPGSTFRFSCSGSDACGTTAESCAQGSWTLISDDVPVPASFFLPPEGLGTPPPVLAADTAARDALLLAGFAPPRAPAVRASVAERLVGALSHAFGELGRWITTRRSLDLAGPRAAHAQAGSERGANLTPDRFNFLVTKDVGAERWSISYSYEPAIAESGLVVNQLLSVTGNVFQPDGTPPQFVYCTVQPDSTGSLDDPSSEFRLSCAATVACQTTAEACAATTWQQVPDPVVLQASFFLPPGGLPATPQSDPEILVIGRTSDPPSIVVPEFSTGGAVALADVPAGTCPTGSVCTVAVVGSCQDVQGTVVDVEGFGCGCEIADPQPECIACGAGASGQCGAACEYQVSSFTARGTCLPFDYESEECACYAVGAGAQQAVEGCGGVLGAACPDTGSGCCATDPRGACDPLNGLVSCPGICVEGDAGCFTGAD